MLFRLAMAFLLVYLATKADTGWGVVCMLFAAGIMLSLRNGRAHG